MGKEQPADFLEARNIVHRFNEDPSLSCSRDSFSGDGVGISQRKNAIAPSGIAPNLNLPCPHQLVLWNLRRWSLGHLGWLGALLLTFLLSGSPESEPAQLQAGGEALLYLPC